MCVIKQFLHKVRPIQFTLHDFIVFRIFIFSLIHCNTYSFLTESVQMILSTFLQFHISELSSYFRCNFLSVQFLAAHKVGFQMQHFSSFFLKFKLNFLMEWSFFLLNAALAMTIMDRVLPVHLASFLSWFPNILNVPCSPFFYIHHSLYCGWLPWDSHYLIFFYP